MNPLVLAGLASTSFIVALSGALMPGPLLTVTVGEAARRGFWAGPLIMVGHALLETFTDRREDGSRALAIDRFAGSYAGSFTELAWNHNRNASDVLTGTTLSIGFSALFNIAKELTGLAH